MKQFWLDYLSCLRNPRLYPGIMILTVLEVLMLIAIAIEIVVVF